jgi:SAM-dependent methyltransferase
MVDDGLRDVVERLVCPLHGSRLHLESEIPAHGVPWPDSTLICKDTCTYKVQGGIPRFVPQLNYADAFGLQWERYQKTQLDSYTGQQISLLRLERCLGTAVSELNGKKVLECGSGAGRFTEHLLGNAGLLVSMDISQAVEANLRNLSGKFPYLLLQADINNSPLPKEFFDIVVCLGVVQHTPSPEQTIASLAAHLVPGGLLVIDHYTRLGPLSRISETLTLRFPLREILKRVPSRFGLQATIALTAICDPLRRQTCKVPWIDRFASRILPSICYYRTYPELDPTIIYEWNELDTHDTLTDYYKHRRTSSELVDCLSDLGLKDIRCQRDGNGVELRARMPFAYSPKDDPAV